MNPACRVGLSRRRTPAKDPDTLRWEYREDDGRQGEPLHYPHGWPVFPCPDCLSRGKRHEVVWYEAGYVPGTRLCLYCGSFWELTTVRAIARRSGEPEEALPESTWLLRRMRFYR